MDPECKFAHTYMIYFISVRLSDLNLLHRNCTYTEMNYTDPHYPDISRHAIIFKGPQNTIDREAIFLHFMLEDETRDFFTVSYFVFPEFDQFNRRYEIFR